MNFINEIKDLYRGYRLKNNLMLIIKQLRQSIGIYSIFDLDCIITIDKMEKVYVDYKYNYLTMSFEVYGIEHVFNIDVNYENYKKLSYKFDNKIFYNNEDLIKAVNLYIELKQIMEE